MMMNSDPPTAHERVNEDSYLNPRVATQGTGAVQRASERSKVALTMPLHRDRRVRCGNGIAANGWEAKWRSTLRFCPDREWFLALFHFPPLKMPAHARWKHCWLPRFRPITKDPPLMSHALLLGGGLFGSGLTWPTLARLNVRLTAEADHG